MFNFRDKESKQTIQTLDITINYENFYITIADAISTCLKSFETIQNSENLTPKEKLEASNILYARLYATENIIGEFVRSKEILHENKR